MRANKRNLFFLLISILIFKISGSGAARASGPTNMSSNRMETVIVTATKTEADIQKIPVGATVISGDLIEDANIDNTLELTRLIPNVYLKKSTSENVISMRGITSDTYSVFSPTAFYIDDVLLPLHYAHNIDLVDIERVEVLRGPQGTLYGGNSLNGVVTVITRRPDNQPRFDFSGEIGAYTSRSDNPVRYSLSGSAAGPIVKDRFYAGIVGRWEDGEGYMTNLDDNDDNAAETDRKNARVTLRWTPTPRFDITLRGDVLDNDDGIAVYRYESGPYRTDRYKVSHNYHDFQKEEGDNQSLRIDYTGESVRILSISGRRDYWNRNLQDYDCTSDPDRDWGASLSTYDDDFLSQELRVSPAAQDGPFTWLLGAHGFIEETDILQKNPTGTKNALTTVDTDGYAIFGEGTYTIFNRLHLTAGFRYDVRELEGRKRDTDLSLAADMDYDEVLPKFSVGYDFTDAVYAYTTVTKGYLAGGYNYSAATDLEAFAYDAEYAWNYEAGVKTTWFNRKLLANLTFFYIDMEDKQVPGKTATGRYKVDNAAESHSKGFELELQARPATGWEIIAGLGYTGAEFDDWKAPVWNNDYTALILKDYSGKTVPNVPEFTGNLGVQYRHGNGLFARADLKSVGSLYADRNNRFEDDAYYLFDLQIGYESERFTIALWGKNIFDTEYNHIAYDYSGDKLVQDGDPALFGLRAGIGF